MAFFCIKDNQGLTKRKVFKSKKEKQGKIRKLWSSGGYLAIFRLLYILPLCISNSKIKGTKMDSCLGMKTVVVQKRINQLILN